MSESIERVARELVSELTLAGHTAYFAGGFVRDLLLCQPCDDIDIATSATPNEVMRLFPKTVPVGVAFGSVVVIREGISFEVTTFRHDLPYLDGRHPSGVTFSNAEEDAKRRSFTINGLFYDPLKDEILDFVDGVADLKRGVIRAIGEPLQRFEEDRLRLIRAVRFSVRLGFPIERKTEEAIVTCAHHLMESVAPERIWQEFVKAYRAPHFARFLTELHRLHLLEQIFPELKDQAIDVTALAHFPRHAPLIAALALLFPGLYPLDTFKRLKVSNADIKWLDLLERLAKIKDDIVEWVHFYAEDDAETALRIRAASLPTEERLQFLAYHHRQRLFRILHITRIQERRPLVTADMLLSRGVQKGPALGQALRRAERIAIERNLNTSEEILAVL